jgi:hypothetical protein
LIQGTALVVTDKDVGVVKVTLAMKMVVAATVEDGPVTLAAAEAVWVQAAIVALPGAVLVLAEDLEVGMLLDRVKLAVTATIALVAVEAAGDLLQVLLMLLVWGGQRQKGRGGVCVHVDTVGMGENRHLSVTC